jgi:hypothetical protein
VLGFSLLFWISNQYLKVFGGTDFEDQLEVSKVLKLILYL